MEEMQVLCGFDASLRVDFPSPKLPHELFQAKLNKEGDGVDSALSRIARRVNSMEEQRSPMIIPLQPNSSAVDSGQCLDGDVVSKAEALCR